MRNEASLPMASGAAARATLGGTDVEEQLAVAWHGRGDVRLEHRSLPASLPPDWVRIRVAWCGICGSDLAEYAVGPVALRARPNGEALSLILGHEISGVVVGADGDARAMLDKRVVTDTLVTCGACPACRRGDVNLCPHLEVAGFSLDGGLAEYVDVPAASCHVIPDDLDLDIAALAEPLAVAVRAVKLGAIGPSDQPVVVGLGAIGLLLGLLLSASRPQIRGTWGVDLSTSRAGHAARLADLQVASTLAGIPIGAAGDQPWVAFECSGSEAALNDLIERAPNGSTIVLVGAHARRAQVNLHAFLHSELRLIASLSHSRADTHDAVDLLAKDPERFRPILTHHLRLQDAPQLFVALTNGATEFVKVVIGPDGASANSATAQEEESA
jgi:threonine dehydrogenase-like Zn-dependent dehydrogenase